MEHKKYTHQDYERVHKLAYEYKDGNTEAGDKLLDSFSSFLNRYVSLLFYGYFDLKHSSTRNFIKLFVVNKKRRSAIGSFMYNEPAGVTIALETVEKIKSLFSSYSKEDIQQEISYVFLTMAKNYKDSKPSFQNHIDKNFHFYAFRYLEKLIKDPLTRDDSSTAAIFKVSRGAGGNEQFEINLLELIPDESYIRLIENKDLEICASQDRDNSNITVISNMKQELEDEISMYDDNFLLDANWINGITCSEVFDTLSPFERRMLVMWYIEKRTDSYIADTFGVCRVTINTKRAKAKRKLEKELKRLNLIKS